MNFSKFLSSVGQSLPRIQIVDVGANALLGTAPYKTLLDSGAATLIGFEPDPEPFANLQKSKRTFEHYLPFAIGDGRQHTLRICRMSGMNSLLEPNHALLSLLHHHGNWAQVKNKIEVQTRRLDDIVEVTAMDYLKIDIQGSELMVFENATRLLKDCLVLHTEAMFVPMYINQPLYADQAKFLTHFGLVTHKFFELVGHAIKPFAVNNDGHAPLSQIFWADVIFIKDITSFETLHPTQLLKLATILNDVYGSVDVAHLALMAYDKLTDSSLAVPYAKLVTHQRSS